MPLISATPRNPCEVDIDALGVHVFVAGSNASTRRPRTSRLPPTAYRMPLAAVTPRPYRVVGVGALVVQLPPPGETSKLGARRVAWRVGSVDCSQLTMRAAPANSAAGPGKRSKDFIIHLAPLDHDRGN